MEHGVKKSFTNLREVNINLKAGLSFTFSIKGKGGLKNTNALRV